MSVYGLSQQDASMEHAVWEAKSSPFQYCLNKLALLRTVKRKARFYILRKHLEHNKKCRLRKWAGSLKTKYGYQSKSYAQPGHMWATGARVLQNLFPWPVVNFESNSLSILLSIDTAHFFSKSSLSACLVTNIPDKNQWNQMNYFGVRYEVGLPPLLVRAPNIFMLNTLHILQLPVFQS